MRGAIGLPRRWSVVGEVVRIDALDVVSGHGRHPNVVLDHEHGELLSINEDDASRQVLNKGLGIGGEGARCDKHTLVGLAAHEAPSEGLNDGSAYTVFPPLGLDVNPVEAETVLVDLAVNPTVATLADHSRGIESCVAASPHSEQITAPAQHRSDERISRYASLTSSVRC